MLGRPVPCADPGLVLVVSPDHVVAAAVAAALRAAGHSGAVGLAATRAPTPRVDASERLVAVGVGRRIPGATTSWPGRRVVAIGGPGVAATLAQVARLGGAVLDGDVPIDELTAALHERLHHSPDPAESARVVGTLHRAAHARTLLQTLTAQERRVLGALGDGLPACEIARALQVSVATARAHIRAILRKLEVSHQLGAVAIAHQARPGPPGIANVDDAAPSHRSRLW